MSRDKEYNASIVELNELHDELRIVRIKTDEDLPPFTPGQYIEIGLYPDDPEITKITRRQYSIASTPEDQKGFELFIVLVKGGTLTSPFWSLGKGARLWVNPKIKGKFTLDNVPEGKNYIFISTGTGLAPFISMLRTYEDNSPWQKLCIIHGVRFPKDLLGYDEELRSYAEKDPQFCYIPCVTRDSSFDMGLQGRIPQCLEDGSIEEKLGRKLDPDNDQILICGNPAMIDDLVKSLENRGFTQHKRKTPGNIHFERYW